MSNSILPVSLPPLPSLSGQGPSAESLANGTVFSNVLADAIQKVESFQTNAEQSVSRFLSGEGEEVHQVALKTQQADLSFQLFMQVRNKVVSAYQEVMRMQL